MLLYLFLFIVFVHALFHLMMFKNAFADAHRLRTAGNRKKAFALAWLFVCIVLLLAIFLLLTQNINWGLVAIVAGVMSQVLVIINWKQAKWGTIINLFILLSAIPSFANNCFNNNANKTAATIFAGVSATQNTVATKEMVTSLPAIVQKWLIHSGVIGNKKTNTVRLKQRGELRTSLQGKWMPFTASEYFTVTDPAFVWTARISMVPPIFLTALDKFENGQGASDIKLFALFSMGSAANNYKTNTASMLRYLAETCLFPSSALGNCIQWSEIDSLSAKATMRFNGITVAGIFTFTANGDVQSFIADRFYTDAADAKEKPWLVQFSDWKTFHGYRIPAKSKITWRLETGDFYWANIEITTVEYNCTELY